MSAHVYRRRIHFDEVDPARILFFGRYLNLAHEALEDLFDSLAGGYAGMIRDRDLGVPAVKVSADYSAPLMHGDEVEIAVDVTHIGTTSFTLRYRFTRGSDATHAATIHHTCVLCTMSTLAKRVIDGDVRALLERHRAEADS